jgi:Ni,Fe-hydrogenase I small subunit
MRHCASLAGVERASMEETAECPDAVGVLEAMAIDRPGCPAMFLMDAS